MRSEKEIKEMRESFYKLAVEEKSEGMRGVLLTYVNLLDWSMGEDLRPGCKWDFVLEEINEKRSR